MIHRDDITAFVNQILGHDLLETAARVDMLPNGIQIEGAESVQTVALGVSVSPEFVNQAVALEAQYIITHHGLNLGRDIIAGNLLPVQSRLKALIKHDITLAGYHYALDAHPTLGNNAQIISAIGAIRTNEAYFDGWGWVAEFDTPISLQELTSRCATAFAHDIFTVNAGPQEIKRIGVCSGGARPGGKELVEIKFKHIDAHITGEINEAGPHVAEEVGFHYLAGGHYATETFGVQALAHEISQHFGDKLSVEFIDVPSVL